MNVKCNIHVLLFTCLTFSSALALCLGLALYLYSPRYSGLVMSTLDSDSSCLLALYYGLLYMLVNHYTLSNFVVD